MIKKIKLFYLFIPFLTFILFITGESISLFLTIKSTKEASRNLIIDIINNKPENFDANFQSWQKQITKLKNKVNKTKIVTNFLPKKYNTFINQTKNLLDLITQFNIYLPKIVGKESPKTYLILLQNNLELRPSGGFMGSYAKITFKKGGIKNLTIQDIYVPDGQLKGHVDPPWPIQTAFKQGWWRLRDSNWEPDFPTASQQIQWFFEKGGEEKADGLIAINFLLVKDLLRIVEPINIPDYDYEITADNLYQITQNESERNFFPGSTQKKDFLAALTKYLILEVEKLNTEQLIQLIKVIKKGLDEKQILINFNDSRPAKFFSQLNWNGAVKRKYPDDENLITDYVYIVDTNLGANKANCCVQRKVVQEVDINKNGLIKENLKITYINNSPKERPKPPLFWGGIYENFLRIILPKEVNNIEIKINGQPLKDRIEIKNYEKSKLKSIGFFVITQPLSQSLVEISYQKKTIIRNPQNYYLELQKQPGMESYPHLIKIKTPEKALLIEKDLKTDEIIKINF